MSAIPSQKQKAEELYALHHSGKILVLPNIWDPLGALLLQSLDFPAIATASAAIAYANGYHDGEKIPFKDLLSILKKIAGAVLVPVTADIESGYADNNTQLRENIKLLLDTGIVGINIEDTNGTTKSLYSIETQCTRIRLIKETAKEMDVPLFINARTDVILYGNSFATAEEKLDEIINRAIAYKEAGADCIFPIAVKEEEDIKALVTALSLPINILTIPGIPGLKTLNALGVARVSLGPSFLKYAIKAMKGLVLQLQNMEGLEAIIDNEITSDYLKKLVTRD